LLTVTTASQLNEFQTEALASIEKQFVSKPVVLLHGVTSSGKTEIYIHLIQKALRENKQVLYLVPEIALTTQLTGRLKKVFGNKLGVYHSKFSDAERVEIWNNVLNDNGYEVIIGVRSSVFLPFRQLGLIIVDEEHESSYKQYDPAPRYHARNAAIVLASMHGAKTLLGTATPSIESFSMPIWESTDLWNYTNATRKWNFLSLKLWIQRMLTAENVCRGIFRMYCSKKWRKRSKTKSRLFCFRTAVVMRLILSAKPVLMCPNAKIAM
jgi:primosomal protein N'